MTAHAHTAADVALAELKKLGFRVRVIAGTESGVALSAWRRRRFGGASTEIGARGATLEEAAAALLESARKA